MTRQTVFGVYEARTHFSSLAARASHGERITITHLGKPIAVLAPIHKANNESASKESAHRLASLGGSEPEITQAPRRRATRRTRS